MALAGGAEPFGATSLVNSAAGVAVQKIGTSTVHPNEIFSSLHSRLERKVLGRDYEAVSQ